MNCSRLALLLAAAFVSPLYAADLPVTETPIGRLSLPVVPDSVAISPDSSRLAFATNAGNITLEDKGVFLQPPTGRQQSSNLPPNIRSTIRLYIDDKPTAAYEVLTPALFSPDSQRVAYTGQRAGKWHVIVDNRTVLQDADAVPATPLLFSPDSRRIAIIVQRGDSFHVRVDDHAWPPIAAYAVGIPAFSPNSQHLALVARDKGNWVLYLDGKPLPTPSTPPLATPSAPPPPPAPTPPSPPARATAPTPTARASAATPATRPAVIDRFGEFKWRPDSSGVAFFGGIQGRRYQLFSQSIDGHFDYNSPQVDALAKGSPHFSADGKQWAFGTSTRNKWTVLSNTIEAPAAAQNADAIRPDSLAWLKTEDAGGSKLLYLAQRNRKWQLYLNHEPVGEPWDAITEGSFQLSPDKRHYAFGGIRGGKPAVFKDGQILAAHDELGAGTFTFSPDSQQLAYAARNSGQWFVCVDGIAGGMAFGGIAAQRLSFSPNSQRLAFNALLPDKTWRVIVGKDGQMQSKAYDSFVKGSMPVWRDDATLVTIGIQKRVALRLEFRL